MKSPSYRKITRSAKSTANQMAKSAKPAKTKQAASKASKILTAIPPAVAGGLFALDAYYRKGKRYQGDQISTGTGAKKTRRSTEAMFKRKRG